MSERNQERLMRRRLLRIELEQLAQSNGFPEDYERKLKDLLNKLSEEDRPWAENYASACRAKRRRTAW